jgi:Ser/Thr protein kinase RdoA (MazF antagonist)
VKILWRPPFRRSTLAAFYGVCMTFPVPLASGRDADVFAIDADRVLRRYRDGGDVTAEAAVMVHLAGHGFPVPAVYHAEGSDLVMERLPGPTLLTALRTCETDVSSAGRTLADLHDRLRDIPARVSRDPVARVLHLDLHPDNVLLGPRGPVLIDWRNTKEGPHELDVAMSALILAQVAVGDTDLVTVARALLTAFLRAVGGQPLRQLDHAIAMRGADPNLTGQEADDLPRAMALVRDGFRS